ncbi:MAG TPA: class I SAM-dependent methyltransferase [Anaerolineales bacterium]|nr:class I SAM-dependent methyltransferase [Anaerolineales bacterium]
MKSLTFDVLKQIVETNGKLDGWNFSRVRARYDPVLWNYVDVVRQYLKPQDRVLDIGTGGGEIFLSLAPYFGEGIGIDQNTAMIEAAKRNQSALALDNISLLVMEGSALRFDVGEFDVVLLRHLRVCVSEIVRVLRKRGYFITQMVGQRSSLNILDAFGWTPSSFGSDWWQTVAQLADQFLLHGCRIVAQAEYNVPYWFYDLESFMFWLMSVPWPEEIELEKHWQNINRVLETSQTERGIETNEHRGLLIVQKL